MSAPETSPIDALLERIQRRVAAHRTEDLAADEALLDDFRHVALERSVGMTPDELLALRQRIAHLPGRVAPLPPFPVSSRVPAMGKLHALIGRSVRRDTTLLTDRLREVADEVRACLALTLDAAGGERLTALADTVEELADQLRVVELELGETRGRVTDLERRLAALERVEADRSFQPFFSNLDFGDAFRGTREEILLRYHDVADLFVPVGGPVLDLGCGRGEMVELLAARGVEARGVEMDPELVEFCRSIFLDVTTASAHEALEAVPDGSLGGVVLIQVVEHLTPQQLTSLVPLAFRKLRPGGLFVAETVNATSLFVYTRSFYLDPTHTNPIHHEYLSFLLRQAGFASVEVTFRAAVPEQDRLPPIDRSAVPELGDEGVAQLDDRLHQLNQYLFSPQDYLAVAVR